MKENLIIYGLGSHAEMGYAYFSSDSNYKVEAFTVERQYITSTELFGIPVVAFEEVENYYPPEKADMFIAIGPQNLNKIREKYFNEAISKGYHMASYHSSKSNMWSDFKYGANCLIDNGVQCHPFVSIKDNITLIASSIGHHSTIDNHCFISTSIIGANVIVDKNVFIGTGSIIREGIHIGEGSIISMGSIIVKDVEPYSVFAPKYTKKRNIDSRRINLFKKNQQ